MVRKSSGRTYSPNKRHNQPEPRFRLTPFLMAAFIFLLLWDVAGPYGAWKYHRLVKERDHAIAANIEKAKENQRLADDLERLSKDRAFQEEMVRRRLGWVKKGEILYRFIPSRR